MRSLPIEPVAAFRIPDRATRVVVVGCGGNGSHVAHGLARLCHHLRASDGPALDVTLIDGDVFEAKNVGRQLARLRDVGVNKAQALAARLNGDYGVRVEAIPRMLDMALLRDIIEGREWVEGDQATTNLIVVGCVDSIAARTILHSAMPVGPYGHRWLWLDVGNHEYTGQVALGSTRDWGDLRGALTLEGLCSALPSPGLLMPELVTPPPKPKKVKRGKKAGEADPNCEDDVATNRQAFGMNATLAAIAVEYLIQLILSRGVTRLRTTVDLISLTAASDVITASTLAALSGLSIDELRGVARPK